MKYKIYILPYKKTIFAEQGDLLLSVLAKNGYIISAPCGGRGTCGKCTVGLVVDENIVYVQACKTFVNGDVTVMVGDERGDGVDFFRPQKIEGEQDGLGVALDIGTTTMAVCLVDMRTGETLRKASCLNPQSVFGADVLSRIHACQEGNLQALQRLVIDKTAELLAEIAHGEKVKELVIAANTTMLHLFLGVNPESIGGAPFMPVFTGMQSCTGEQLGLPVEKITLLPSVSGYIGGDITSGLLACGILQNKSNALFVDIGTNGEIVLSRQGELYATSTAAGPALEGACIECGLGGVDGAIDKVFYQDKELRFTTIGNTNPKGICGSGLVDLIAVLFKEGLIDENGAWSEDSTSALSGKLKDDKFYLTDTVYLSQKDIRQFQLAKSAIRSGIETLLCERGICIEDIQTLYVAGGLGYYLNLKNAGHVGLLPTSLLDRIQLVGNTSLQGATLCLLKQIYRQEIERIAKCAEVVELSSSKYFMDAYIENMSFIEETDV